MEISWSRGKTAGDNEKKEKKKRKEEEERTVN